MKNLEIQKDETNKILSIALYAISHGLDAAKEIAKKEGVLFNEKIAYQHIAGFLGEEAAEANRVIWDDSFMAKSQSKMEALIKTEAAKLKFHHESKFDPISLLTQKFESWINKLVSLNDYSFPLASASADVSDYELKTLLVINPFDAQAEVRFSWDEHAKRVVFEFQSEVELPDSFEIEVIRDGVAPNLLVNMSKPAAGLQYLNGYIDSAQLFNGKAFNIEELKTLLKTCSLNILYVKS